MRYFGVRRVLAFADAPTDVTAKAVLLCLDALVERELPRLSRAGIQPFAAVGLHPASIPRRGLNQVMSHLPEYFVGGQVVAVGETGLYRGDEAEVEAFLGQLELARKLKLPVVVHTPSKEKERLTRVILTQLRRIKISPERVLVDHAAASTVRLILACGHYAGLTLHPDELKAERAVALVQRLGSTRLVVNSDAGARSGDMLCVPRALSLLEKAKLSSKVRARLAHGNMEAFLGLE
jgi:predicted metal-dependent TIM-barrel fold hydrolase